MRRLALAAVLFFAATPAFAQDEDDDRAPAGRTYIVQAVTILDIEDGIDIDAEIVKPPGTLLFDRKRAGFKPLIHLRADFNDELDTSVDEVR
jgi:hypothetical protein